MTDPIVNMSHFYMNQATANKGVRDAETQAGDEAQLEKACRGFESLFVNYLMQQMRDTVPESGFLGGGQAEKIYTTMLDGEVSKTISDQRGIGLAKLLYDQMSALNGPLGSKK